MISRLSSALILSAIVVVTVAEDKSYDGPVQSGRDGNIDYSMSCGCFNSMDELSEWSEKNNNKLTADEIQKLSYDYMRTTRDLYYFNGPWNFNIQTSPTGETYQRNVHYRGLMVEYDEFATKQWKIDAFSYRPNGEEPPNVIITHTAIDLFAEKNPE